MQNFGNNDHDQCHPGTSSMVRDPSARSYSCEFWNFQFTVVLFLYVRMHTIGLSLYSDSEVKTGSNDLRLANTQKLCLHFAKVVIKALHTEEAIVSLLLHYQCKIFTDL